MAVKCVASIDFTSFQALKTFIRIVKEAGGSVSISGEMRDDSAILDNPMLITDIELGRIFSSVVKDDVTSTMSLERAKAVLNLEPSHKAEKSAACTLLESVANFPRVRHTC